MASSSPKSTRFWLILLALVAVACVVGLFLVRAQRQAGGTVQIIRDGQVEETFPLSENRTLRYETDHGYNVVVIENGTVRVSEASCADQICVRHGPTNQTADPIVCLPNKLVVKVLPPHGESQLDGVSS
ncbi:MAG: NusG domain II-containing protein [Evtepia sp.]|uniref:NusG domain II-containing protein n=1 Tax=Evtepia sp. TaxID=2773933 RepID=UPI002A76079F|nr:NusG domain II-containing protein [Evtepia sp.]MDY3015315.1 NusG domain II-containing protein [Evtepia sp.]